ncbi:PilC/PilY family type IV pilus protein [Marinobacter sp. MA]|uniref:pilus assembly protein n=1 Tax=Marinobacter sp. MA TaxID=2971606 RepID=UPI003AAF72DE
MNKFRFIRNVSLAHILVLSPFASSVSADDTEIFFNIERDISSPNILFILDNSGSMDTFVEVSESNYDPSQSYEGNANDDFVYYEDGGNWYTIRKTVIECQDINTKLDTLGRTSPYKMAYFYRNRWNSFSYDNVNNSRTVCQADGNNEVDWGDISAEEFYSANYLNWYENREVTYERRIDIVKRVAKNLADGLENVNIGLMAFDRFANDFGEGGVVLEAIRPISEGRSSFKDAVDDLGADTNTPLSETLFGAKRYFEGGSPFLSPSRRQADNAMDGDSYSSPIELECQANYVVLLTDGEPTRDTNHNDDMEDELGINGCDGNCLDEIAEYMYTNDLNDEYDGTQRVVTYTVGFQSDQQLLDDAATKGGGEYYLAESADQLEGVFNEIFRQVLSTNTTFSSPGVSVNNFNQLNYLDALYFSVFEPVVEPLWPGNLKRYRLTSAGDIVDQNGNDAIDPVTGFFKDTARSYWSSGVDGAVASAGGAASVIPDDNSQRNVYTYYVGSTSQSLTNAVNNVVVGNDNLTKTLFGDADMSDARLQELIRFTRGQDVDDEDDDGSTSDSRKFIADPLHSRPYLQVYGGTEEDPDTTVFFGDNQGFLHALDGETGQLNFSFMPGELLANQGVYRDNLVSEFARPYGMDGSITAWFQDIDRDRVVDEDDSVYIYSGMRRGGRNYYGLDVTDRDAPSVLWAIRGGQGDFTELGQTWSDPVKHRVRLGDEIREVLFFSGGYDTNQDDVAVRTEDSMGRAIYMVDASTGERLWWSGPADSDADLELADMDYSIPATPAVIDVNGDRLADQLYVGDMGGQIWRVDLRNGQEAANFATAGVIADLAGSTEASNRRFYHTPDLSGTLKNGQRYLNLAIGSGYQASPLDKGVEDRFYKLTISSIAVPLNQAGEVEYTTLTEADLMDTTDNLIQEGTEEQREAAETSLSQAQGWYIRLTRDGEKVLSSSTTLRGDVFFTTFEPAASLDPCVPSAGQSRLYHVELADGRAVVNYDKLGSDDALTESDRYVALKTLGLPPSPKAITIDGEDIIVAGTETLVPPPPGGLVRKIYWYEE